MRMPWGLGGTGDSDPFYNGMAASGGYLTVYRAG